MDANSLKSLFKKSIVILLMLCTMFSVLYTPNTVLASSGNKLDTSDVLYDLRAEQGFDIKNYPYIDGKECELIRFEEYCYSFYSNRQDNYGLYVYIYNPSALDIEQDSILNTIQICTSFDEDGMPTAEGYIKYNLQFCSMASEADYYRLFYKFKVIDKEGPDGKTILERVNSNNRQYNVSGIELKEVDKINAHEINLGVTFSCTGYAKGYGPNIDAEDTSTLVMDNFETVKLDVKDTVWRSKRSSKGNDHQNQVNSVYFTVPNRLLREYGKLQRIKAEWYEYVTKNIVGIDNKTYYDGMFPYMGTGGGDATYSLAGINFGRYEKYIKQSDGNFKYYYHGNPLYYMFLVNDFSAGYESNKSIEAQGGISSKTLKNYIKAYSDSHEGEKINGKYNAELFEDYIDADRVKTYNYEDGSLRGEIKRGYSYLDFDADLDIQKFSSFLDVPQSQEEYYKRYGVIGTWWYQIFGFPEDDDYGRALKPIQLLTDDDLQIGTNLTSAVKSSIADTLCVGYDEVEDLRKTYTNAKENDETVVLFRFAVTDYESYNTSVFTRWNTLEEAEKYHVRKVYQDVNAYVAKETVFLDFDVIQLTFFDNEKYTIIPVVSDPIDIVPGITPPVAYSGCNDALIIFIIVGVLVLALLVYLLWPVMPIILEGIIFVLKFLWFCVKWLIKGLWLILKLLLKALYLVFVKLPARLIKNIFKKG